MEVLFILRETWQVNTVYYPKLGSTHEKEMVIKDVIAGINRILNMDCGLLEIGELQCEPDLSQGTLL